MSIELTLNTLEEKINIEQEIKDSAKDPFIFYILNKDFMSVLPIFVIIDFQKETIKYINTFTANNIKIIKSLPNGRSEASQTPHCSVGNTDKFYNFTYNLMEEDRSPLFREVDVLNKKMYLITPEDISANESNALECCDTVSVLEDGSFLMSYFNGESNSYHKVSMDLKKSEFVFRDTIMKSTPHQVCDYKNWILATGFFEREFSVAGEYFSSTSELVNYIKNLKQLDGHKYNFRIDLTNHDPFARQIGYIIAYNKKTKITHRVKTITSPSHIEIDPETDMCYIASNNMINFENEVWFIGEGTVEQFKMDETEIYRTGTFINPKGYRFTTHKFFKKNGNPYLAIFGYPNRLFIVDAKTMELDYYDDIGPDYLSAQQNVKKFLNEVFPKTPIHPHRLSGMCVTDDNKFIMFPDQENLLFYEIESRKIKYKIPFKKDNYFHLGNIFGQFCQYSLHCDFLRN